jgi:hypothetical protein
MTDHDFTPLGAALRDRVRDEDPDLDHLIRVSTRAGSRLRRRRVVGVSAAGVAAGVAVVGIVGAALGGSGGTTGSEPGLASEPTAVTSTPADSEPTPAAPQGQDLPVHVDPSLTGWEIGIAGDDKFPASKGDYFLGVVVRPMTDYAAWSGGDPDRPADQVVHVGDNYFVTMQPNPDVPPAVVAELTDALRYDATWHRKGAHRAQ